jgi:hypothetical protein
MSVIDSMYAPLQLTPLPVVTEFDEQAGAEAWALCLRQQAIRPEPREKPLALELEPML